MIRLNAAQLQRQPHVGAWHTWCSLPPAMRMVTGRDGLLLFAFLFAAGLPACGPEGGVDETGDMKDGNHGGGAEHPPGTTPTPAGAVAVLEVHARDLWAQPFPDGEATLQASLGGAEVPLDGSSPARIYLTGAAATFTLRLSAPEHEALEVLVDYDGSAELSGARVASATAGHGASLAHGLEAIEGKEVPVHRVYLGLRHRWFSAEGRPARRGNLVDVLMDGEEAWSATYQDLAGVQSSVLAATWWWESDFELVRDPASHAYLTPDERWKNTVMSVLETSPAFVRVLVGQFWGQDGVLAGVNVDDALLYYAEHTGEAFEFMGQANETEGEFMFELPPFSYAERLRGADQALAAMSFDPESAIASTVPTHWVDLTQWPIEAEVQAASYHQKFMVIDSDIAYVGGMNIKATDWDTSAHAVFEPRRMKFEASTAAREAVGNGEELPDVGPRKDYIVRLEGPAAQDVADVFQRRWEHQLAAGVEYAENASSFEVNRDIAPRDGGTQVQVTATLPEPFWEHAIAETWFNAVRNAEQFIFIEDQYFRIPMLHDTILERMSAKPDLRLVVITKPVSEWVDPGCAQTHLAHQLFAATFPDRYMTLQLRAFDTQVTWGWDETKAHFVDIDVHSKVLIVDDVFASIGSANKNNRGIVYEGELNVAIVGEQSVRPLRRRIFSNLLPGAPASNDVATWWGHLSDAAAYNDWVRSNWTAEGDDIDLDGAAVPDDYLPWGFVYSLQFGTLDDCLMESVGPDVTGELPPSDPPGPEDDDS
jgi:hypothetical protein